MKQLVRRFLGSKDLDIQQKMSVWVGSPKSEKWANWKLSPSMGFLP